MLSDCIDREQKRSSKQYVTHATSADDRHRVVAFTVVHTLPCTPSHSVALHAWGPAGMGRGRHLPFPGNVEKCFVLQKIRQFIANRSSPDAFFKV